MSDDHIKLKLRSYFASQNPKWTNIELINFELQLFKKTNILSDIYFFDLSYNENLIDVDHQLVLKLGLGTDRSTAAIWKSEMQVMSKLYECHYPVPRIFGFAESLIEERGAFIIMERIEGKMLSDLINENEDNLQAIDCYIKQYARQMVELHNLKVQGEVIAIGRKNEMFTSGHQNPIEIYLKDYLKFTEHIKYDTLSRVIGWLLIESNYLDQSLILGMTHGDYQTDNVIVLESKELSIIDWGFARTADIRIDIQWTRLLNRFMHSSEVSDHIYEQYKRLQERTLSDNTFFSILSMVRLLVGLSQLAIRSENYHDNVNRFIKTMDMNFMRNYVSDHTGLMLPKLESDFRNITGVKA